MDTRFNILFIFLLVNTCSFCLTKILTNFETLTENKYNLKAFI